MWVEWTRNEKKQSVAKRRHINSRRRGITQKKAHNIQNTAKAWNQQYYVICVPMFLLDGVVKELRSAAIYNAPPWFSAVNVVLHRSISMAVNKIRQMRHAKSQRQHVGNIERPEIRTHGILHACLWWTWRRKCWQYLDPRIVCTENAIKVECGVASRYRYLQTRHD